MKVVGSNLMVKGRVGSHSRGGETHGERSGSKVKWIALGAKL